MRGSMSAASKREFLVEHGIVAALQRLPVGHTTLPLLALRRKLAPFQIGESGLVGGNETASGTHLDGEVAEGQASFHRHVAHHVARILHEIARGTAGGELRHQIERHVLGRHALSQRAVDADAHRLWLLLQNALRGHDHLYLRRSDAESHGTHGPVGRGVRVAADNGHARQREALLRAHHMDDAVVGRHHAVVGQSELAGITLQRVHLLLRHGVGDGFVLVVSGRVVVGHAVNLSRTEALQTARTQTVESLRRCHLVTIEPVNIKLCGTVGHNLHHVLVPYLVE